MPSYRELAQSRAIRNVGSTPPPSSVAVYTGTGNDTVPSTSPLVYENSTTITNLQSAAVSLDTRLDTAEAKLATVSDNANNYVHPNHTGDVTSAGDGAATITNAAVTNAKLANMSAATIKGRETGTGAPTDLSPTQVRTIINVADGSTAGATWGTNLSSIPAMITSLTGLNPSAGNIPYFTGASTLALIASSADARSFLAAANYAAMRTALGVEIGTNVQAYNANLNSLAGLTLTADQIAYSTGAGTFALTPISAFARTFLDDADAAAVRATIGAVAAGHTHVAANITDFSAGVTTAWGSPINKVAIFDGAGLKATADLEEVEEARVYHILTNQAVGMIGDGIALDKWLHADLPLTPSTGTVTWLWPLDPSTSVELPEVAEAQANRGSNAVVTLTTANTDSGNAYIAVPVPIDTAMATGINNRTIKHRFLNSDFYTTFNVDMAPASVGLLGCYWNTGLTDVDLGPGDELLTSGRIVGNRVDFSQQLRLAEWATIAARAGSGGSAAGSQRTLLNVVEGDYIFILAHRVTGTAITTPSGKGYVTFSGNGFETDGRILGTDRSYKLAYTVAPTTGSYATGTFSGATRVWAVAISGVGSVGKFIAAKGTPSASLDYPTVPTPFAPDAHIIGFTARALSTHAKPTSSTVLDTNTFFDSGATSTSGAFWTMGEVASHAPSALAQTSAEWASMALELRPKRIN